MSPWETAGLNGARHGACWSRLQAMKSYALVTLMILSATGANAADKAMFCKATQKDLFAPETFAVVIKQDKIAYMTDANAFFIDYRVKFERGPETLAEAVHDNGEVLLQIYFNNKSVTVNFTGGAKGSYACSATAI
jgi:hypothetical protein